MKILSLKFQYILRYIILLFFSLNLIVNECLSQQEETSFNSKNAVYIDFSTIGAYYSINYDRIFYQKKINLSYRIGFSVLQDAIALPVGMNLFFGKKNSYAEIGLSIIPYIDHYKSFMSDNDLSDKYIYIVPGFGYRYQKYKKGFFFKIAVSPILFLDPPSDDFWKMDPQFYFMANMGIGLSF